MNIDASSVADLLDRSSLIDTLDDAFRVGCEAPTRHHHRLQVPGGADATLLLMPAWIPGRYVGLKIAQVFPDNGKQGLPSVQSVYLLSNGRTGQLLAIIDGGELTSRRTVAASSLAARRLARQDAKRLLIVGTGQIARHIAFSHAAVRPITEIDVWGRDEARARDLARHLTAEGFRAQAATQLAGAAARADIVSCCTLSTVPLIHGAWLRPGTHIDLIGGFTPAMREVDDAAVARSDVFIDTEAALAEAGDLLVPLSNGVIERSHIKGDLADLAAGRHPGRRSDDEITLFKSVGASIEDLVAAVLCYERALANAQASIPGQPG